MREKTRRERYDEKKVNAKTYPISIATINFMHDGNLGYTIRSAACFGAECVHVIGSVPPRGVLNPLSGTTYDYVEIRSHSNPREFIEHCRQNDIQIVAAEIGEESESIRDFRFDFSKHTCFVIGHEEAGIPFEITKNSQQVHIPMPGVGFCLNTSQTGNIMLYEATKQYDAQQRFIEEWKTSSYIHHP
jgi:tRNA G18 (ribose-2'-O)-methylase SpoU